MSKICQTSRPYLGTPYPTWRLFGKHQPSPFNTNKLHFAQRLRTAPLYPLCAHRRLQSVELYLSRLPPPPHTHTHTRAIWWNTPQKALTRAKWERACSQRDVTSDNWQLISWYREFALDIGGRRKGGVCMEVYTTGAQPACYADHALLSGGSEVQEIRCSCPEHKPQT
jgi:hypothetical protein